MKTLAFRSRIAVRAVRFLIVFVLLGLTGGAGAQTSLGALFTGLYSVPGEEGSGLTATHEEPVIFLTFYIYRADRAPYWLTATVVRGPDLNGSHNYTGDLYETNGPPFGGAFDPKTVTYRKVGTVSFLSRDGYTATLTYTIDGVFFSKTYNRFTLSDLNFAGPYYGTILYQPSCASPTSLVRVGPTTVTQSATALTIVVQGSSATCTLSGDYVQSGSLSGSSGNFSCTEGTSGPMVIAGMQWTIVGFTAEFAVNVQQCNLRGAITAIRVSGP
jgi:hypothetical protein